MNEAKCKVGLTSGRFYRQELIWGRIFSDPGAPRIKFTLLICWISLRPQNDQKLNKKHQKALETKRGTLSKIPGEKF